MQILTIHGIEAALNKCKRENPTAENGLSPLGSALAEIYGLMIFSKETEVNFTSGIKKGVFGDVHIQAIEQFYEQPSENKKEQAPHE